jgi:thiol:disulfide interchange protein DsbD
MKKNILLFLFAVLCAAAPLKAQILEPVTWKITSSEINSNNEMTITFRAIVEKGWYVYGTDLPEGGPVSTNFVFEELKNAVITGKIVNHSKLITKFEPAFDMELSLYAGEAVFTQKVKIKNPEEKHLISGFVEFMACNNEMCLPPVNEPFTIGNIEQQPVNTSENAGIFSFAPVTSQNEVDFWEPVIHLLQDDTTENTSEKGMLLWIILITGFLHGLIAIFTPCVWPIIPITVSFFLKRNEGWKKGKKDALLYGASIVVIYLLLGIVITLIFGANALSSLAASTTFNLFFFALLVLFGASLMGAFELALPASWTTKLDAKAEKSTGIWSIFLMAFTLVLVSFSCTGPIIGKLLVDVIASGSILAPAVGMFGFALALALPFTLFALFPAMMKAMPKSGSWLNAVKVVLGFLLLALALKYLSIADLARDWGILSREVFLVLWIVIFFLLGLYLLGKIRFAHDSEVKTLSFGRLVLSIIPFAFALYMVPGLWGAPLKAISSFAPPVYTQEFNLTDKHSKIEFRHFDEGMIFAQQANKPVLVDFTGYSCSNCKKIEASVLTKPEVRQLISENFVLISLFVDDKTALEEPFKVEENNKTYTIKTLGDKWSYLQRHKFGANAQPYFVILDNEAKPLTKPFGFSENAQDFLDFLNEGLRNLNK